jgi:hypothetical protein
MLGNRNDQFIATQPSDSKNLEILCAALPWDEESGESPTNGTNSTPRQTPIALTSQISSQAINRHATWALPIEQRTADRVYENDQKYLGTSRNLSGDDLHQ